jgi:hypothetical protein
MAFGWASYKSGDTLKEYETFKFLYQIFKIHSKVAYFIWQMIRMERKFSPLRLQHNWLKGSVQNEWNNLYDSDSGYRRIVKDTIRLYTLMFATTCYHDHHLQKIWATRLVPPLRVFSFPYSPCSTHISSVSLNVQVVIHYVRNARAVHST